MGACISVSTSSGFLKKTKRKKSINGCNSRSSSTHHDPSSKDSKKNKKNKNRSSSSSSIMVLKDGVANHDHSLFDKYEFGKELGKGEFGITYKCTNKETGEKVACKRISKCKLRTEIDVEDVRREVEIMQKLPKHPNIVSYKDVYEDKDAIYLLMELCEGGELFERIVAKGHFTERDAANVIKTVMEVVKVCHKHGVIHRDLKPENFLYKDPSEDAPLKAIDFGLSTFFKPGQRFREIVGSPYYMASEVLKRNYGAEIDVWSAGIILYILLCGTPPFFAETEEEIAHAIVKGEVDFKREPWHRISGNAKDLVKGMLEHNPYTRLSVQEVLDHPWLQNMDAVSTVPLGEQVQARIKQFSLMNKFKKRVLRVVAGNLPDHEVDKIKQMFHVMDTNKNGILSFDELKVGINKFVQPMTDPDVLLLLNTADADGNGSLDMEEFVTMAVHLKRVETNDELLGQAFKFFDKDQSGYIEFEDLRESLKEENNGPNNEQVVQDIIFDADLNKDGKISYDEFKAMMTTGIDWKMASRQYSRAKLQALSVKIFKDKSIQA